MNDVLRGIHESSILTPASLREPHRKVKRLVDPPILESRPEMPAGGVEEDAVARFDGADVLLPIRNAHVEQPLDPLFDAPRLIRLRPPTDETLRLGVAPFQRAAAHRDRIIVEIVDDPNEAPHWLMNAILTAVVSMLARWLK